ncbi:kinase-like domain-containing protein [Pterulicium gracile]|uniref:Kinase-like domain-containing protein n=1 Tax=Pterulicium gracile TaxID=1884261 RepID=A0A5C3QIU1_9AGAR|nr:kinase-like domain-containing protein [Pterula gracilis]
MTHNWLHALFSRFRSGIIAYLQRRGLAKYGIMKGKVSRLTSGLVLKDGNPDDMTAEVEALAFVAAHTSIPVPRVQYHWQELDRPEPRGLIIMNLMPGEMLARVWSKISPAQRQHVMRTLAGFVSQLRLLSQPPPPCLSRLPREGWIGSTLGHSFVDCSVTSQIPSFGPFATESDFHDYRLSRYNTIAWSAPTAAKFTDVRRRMRDDHPIVFTHGDFNRRNVLVRVHGPEAEDIEVTALLDWEQAGWRPIYWEPWKWIFETPHVPEWVDVAENGMGYKEDVLLARELQGIMGTLPP